MDVKNTQQNFNVNSTTTITANATVQKTSDTQFADELKKAGKTQEKEEVKKTESSKKADTAKEKVAEKKESKPIKEDKEVQEAKEAKETEETKKSTDSEKAEKVFSEENQEIEQKENTENIKESETSQIGDAIYGLQDIVSEFNKIGQKDELDNNTIKPESNPVDKKNVNSDEDTILIDNNINIQEPNEKLNVQTEANTNFSNNEQPFSNFINQEQSQDILKSTVQELAEEKAILSTMEENIAIANKNMLMKEKAKEKIKENENIEAEQQIKPKTETIQNDKGIKKVDIKTHLVVDTIVSYENVVMDKADVDFFVNLVNNGAVNLSEVQNAEKSSQVSKTLADLLAKAMNENKPVRIDFDNDISVIIKIDRTGKISADFLPSSQIAEAYLKENLPLLKQRFDDNDIEYNELNQRKQKQDSQDENRKKGRKDE